MKNPFKRLTSLLKHKQTSGLSDVQFIAGMQREIDLNDIALKRIIAYLYIPHFGDIENELCIGDGREQYHMVFDFLYWVIKNHPDLLSEFQTYHIKNKH